MLQTSCIIIIIKTISRGPSTAQGGSTGHFTITLTTHTHTHTHTHTRARTHTHTHKGVVGTKHNSPIHQVTAGVKFNLYLVIGFLRPVSLRKNHTFSCCCFLLFFLSTSSEDKSLNHSLLSNSLLQRWKPSIYLLSSYQQAITCVGTYLITRVLNYKNLLKSLVTMSNVAYFIPQAHTGNCVSPN